MKKVLCEDDCPYCKAGIPRKVLIPFFDDINKTIIWKSFSEELATKLGLSDKKEKEKQNHLKP